MAGLSASLSAKKPMETRGSSSSRRTDATEGHEKAGKILVWQRRPYCRTVRPYDLQNLDALDAL